MLLEDNQVIRSIERKLERIAIALERIAKIMEEVQDGAAIDGDVVRGSGPDEGLGTGG